MALLTTVALVAPLTSAAGETLQGALARAVHVNPALNAQRTGALSTRERLIQAQAGWLPRLTATADVGRDIQNIYSPTPYSAGVSSDGTLTSSGVPGSTTTYRTYPNGFGVQLSQSLFDGGRTLATTRQAKSLIKGADESVRNAEQSTLFAAAAAYVNLIRANRLLVINRDNLRLLEKQLSVLRERHGFGDVPAPDLNQTKSRVYGAQIRVQASEALKKETAANYRAVIGAPPEDLVPPRPLERVLPHSLAESTQLALRQHPAICAAEQAVKAARAQIDIVEADFAPNFGIAGTVAKRYDLEVRGDRQNHAAIVGRFSMPLYDGGLVASRTRESRGILTQRELELDSIRDQVFSAVTTAWAQFAAARIQVSDAEIQVRAANEAASGALQLYELGEKSLTDWLIAQQDALAAAESLATARRDVVLASFALAQAIGILTLDHVGRDLVDAGRAEDLISLTPKSPPRLTGLAAPAGRDPAVVTKTSRADARAGKGIGGAMDGSEAPVLASLPKSGMSVADRVSARIPVSAIQDLRGALVASVLSPVVPRPRGVALRGGLTGPAEEAAAVGKEVLTAIGETLAARVPAEAFAWPLKPTQAHTAVPKNASERAAVSLRQ